ncbi:hypothetical protein G6F31_016367 [Rhizopus arrhizus]|nr:hypothetical protein G6F31_016367 [Rhizopus arrhizus]
MRSQFEADDPPTDEACAGQGPRALIGESPALHAVRTVLHKFAPVELPVLVTGETGTGKELAAHALHALSGRAGKPFIAVNCGAIPANLVQSELFGHERGSFTGADKRQIGVFESAQGGTVFLDEGGDLPAEAQTSLLRVLQEGTFERVGSSQSLRRGAGAVPQRSLLPAQRAAPADAAASRARRRRAAAGRALPALLPAAPHGARTRLLAHSKPGDAALWLARQCA